MHHPETGLTRPLARPATPVFPAVQPRLQPRAGGGGNDHRLRRHGAGGARAGRGEHGSCPRAPSRHASPVLTRISPRQQHLFFLDEDNYSKVVRVSCARWLSLAQRYIAYVVLFLAQPAEPSVDLSCGPSPQRRARSLSFLALSRCPPTRHSTAPTMMAAHGT